LPRYFFNFENTHWSMADLIGRELQHDDAAKAEARKIAADLATTDAIEGRPPIYQWIEVVDAHQRPIARLPVAEVIREPNRLR
jgi:hypothetical protein